MPARRPHRLALSAAALAMFALGGCASIVSGTSQPLSVKTQDLDAKDVVGARCTLTNDKGAWSVTTPGSVTVHRSYKDITVACEAAGQPAGSMAVKSSTKAMAFGNVIAGGVIGAGIDMANGAAYDYPDLLTVTMGRVDGPPSAPPAPAAPAAIVPAQAAAPAPAVASVRPAGVRHLQAGTMEGATWTYTTGTAWLYKSGGGWNADSRMEFHGGRVQASNTRLRGDGTYTVADDKLCVNIDSKLWGKACYYVIEAAAGDDEDSGHGLQLMDAKTGERMPLRIE